MFTWVLPDVERYKLLSRHGVRARSSTLGPTSIPVDETDGLSGHFPAAVAEGGSLFVSGHAWPWHRRKMPGLRAQRL